MNYRARATVGLKTLAIVALSFAASQRVITAQAPAPAPTPAVTPKTSSSTKDAVQVLTPTGGVDFHSYLEKMHQYLQKHWSASLPSAYYGGVKGKAVIRFRINSDGTIQDILVEASSGNDSLDQAAVKGIRDSGPLDPLPPDFKGPNIEVRASFLYNQPASLYECSPPTTDAAKAPPFDPLELLAFLISANPGQYEAYAICQRGIDFIPDASFLAAIQLNGAAPSIVSALAIVRPRAGGHPSAERLSAYGLLDAALAATRNRDVAAANDNFERALKLAGDSATLHLAYGRNLLLNQKLPEAEMQFRRSLELWPEDADAHIWLALALLRQERNQEGIPEAREALRIFPSDKMALTTLGFGLARSGQYKEAIPVLQQAIPFVAEVPLVRKHLGGSLLHTGDFDGAIEQLTLFLKTSPNDAEAHYFLGAALRAKGKSDEALAQFREAAQIDPVNPLYSVVTDPTGSNESATATSKPSGPQPDDCFYSGNIYTNTFFGFSYEFPKGWVFQNAETGKKIVRLGGALLANGDPILPDATEAAARTSYQLFVVTKQTTKDVSTKFDLINFSVLDQRFLGKDSKSGENSLKPLTEFLKQKGFTVKGPETFTIDGRTFWRFVLDVTVKNVVTHSVEAVTIEKGYALLFVFTTTDASKLDELAGTIQSIRFTEPSP